MGNKMEWLAEWLWGVTCDPLARLERDALYIRRRGGGSAQLLQGGRDQRNSIPNLYFTVLTPCDLAAHSR